MHWTVGRSMGDEVTTSEYAASMGGSQGFWSRGDTDGRYTDQMHSVASANDACDDGRIHLQKRRRICYKDEQTGKGSWHEEYTFCKLQWSDADGHLTTARDIALMSKELITTYPQIFDYCNIWWRISYIKPKKGESEFGLTNTNKLIRQYEYANHLKTGSYQ